MAGPSQQLALPVRLRDEATFVNFHVTDANRLLLEQLRAQLPSGERYLFVHGRPGAGRSHLLQAACHRAAALELQAFYLPLADVGEQSAAAVLDLPPETALLCLDDIDAVLGSADWQEQLFHLFNRLQHSGARLLVAAAQPPAALDIELKDLQSRLGSGAIYHLKALDDEQRQQALIERAALRGLQLGPEVARYILHRGPRDPARLFDVLDELDRRSLAEQRRLTIPFVKQVMQW